MVTRTREVPTQDDLTNQEQAAVNETLGATPVREKKGRQWSGASPKGKRQAGSRQRSASAHASRAQETRAAETVHDVADEPWVQPATLPYIPPRPGYVQRWVRVAYQDRPDATNSSRRDREGWKPRHVDTLPHNFAAPTIEHGKYSGRIGVEGMILMEMPAERNARRNAHFQKETQRQTDAINHQLAQASSHGHPGFGPVMRDMQTKYVREDK